MIYQIYPRSFLDTDGDGVGDLDGVRRRLDHLVSLGIDAVWVSPFYPSPMADFGYDVSDYTGVDPLFGTMADFDRLIAAMRERDLRLIMDFVPGHTSEAHPWFRDAASSREAAHRDWYVWRDPAPGGGPPNNWLSEFGGPAWTWHEETGQYYLHIFLPEQPTLNWRLPAVADAMFDAMRFWYDRGVDGFRVDAFENVIPHADLPDNPVNPDWTEAQGPARALLGTHTQHQPETYDLARRMRAVAREYGTDPASEKLLIGETYGTLEQVVRYDCGGDGFQLPFNFSLIQHMPRWSAAAVAATVERYEALLPPGAWPNWVLGNHDRARIASRIGFARVRLATMLLMTLRGTPTLYYGDELGVENASIPPDRVRDPWELNAPGLGLGRDPARTPMPWDGDAPHAGFAPSEAEPWLPVVVPPEGGVLQQQEGDTVLAFTCRLVALRRQEPALLVGAYRTVSVADDLLVFDRTHAGDTLRVALNFADGPRDLPDEPGETLLRTRASESAALGPGEGAIYRP